MYLCFDKCILCVPPAGLEDHAIVCGLQERKSTSQSGVYTYSSVSVCLECQDKSLLMFRQKHLTLMQADVALSQQVKCAISEVVMRDTSD